MDRVSILMGEDNKHRSEIYVLDDEFREGQEGRQGVQVGVFF